MPNSGQQDKAKRFRELHQADQILILPNAWDVASAKLLEAAGFDALATTSAGIAYSLGFADGQQVGRDMMLRSVEQIANSVALPVSADLEAGYGDRPEAIEETVRLAMEAGVVGVNLEDSRKDGSAALYEESLAVERIRAARAAADAAGGVFVINARTDACLLQGNAPAALAEAIRRVNAYRAAGADCVFVPGVHHRQLIARLVDEVDGPLNILAVAASPPVAELQEIGVSRVSLGSGIMRAALRLVRQAAIELKTTGTYNFLRDAPSTKELNQFLRRQ